MFRFHGLSPPSAATSASQSARKTDSLRPCAETITALQRVPHYRSGISRSVLLSRGLGQSRRWLCCLHKASVVGFRVERGFTQVLAVRDGISRWGVAKGSVGCSLFALPKAFVQGSDIKATQPQNAPGNFTLAPFRALPELWQPARGDPPGQR